jgi:hypothetical protein
VYNGDNVTALKVSSSRGCASSIKKSNNQTVLDFVARTVMGGVRSTEGHIGSSSVERSFNIKGKGEVKKFDIVSCGIKFIGEKSRHQPLQKRRIDDLRLLVRSQFVKHSRRPS